jgi:hypothetical protein
MEEPGFLEWWATQIAPLARVVKNSDCLPFKEVARAAWTASKKYQKENAHEEGKGEADASGA